MPVALICVEAQRHTSAQRASQCTNEPDVAFRIDAAFDLQRAHAICNSRDPFVGSVRLTHQTNHVSNGHGVTYRATEQSVNGLPDALSPEVMQGNIYGALGVIVANNQ